jgi:hypothetical protein
MNAAASNILILTLDNVNVLPFAKYACTPYNTATVEPIQNVTAGVMMISSVLNQKFYVLPTAYAYSNNYKCEKCQINQLWNGKPFFLVLTVSFYSSHYKLNFLSI